MKRLSFTQTKTDNEQLRIMAHKWDNLLSKNMYTDDNDLKKFIEEEVV